MTKYKLVGIIILLIGISQLILFTIFPLVIIPGISKTYSDFDINSQSNLISSYIIIAAVFLIAVINLFLGVKNFSSGSNKEKYFKFGIVFTITTFFVTLILFAILNISIVSPIYNLNSQF